MAPPVVGIVGAGIGELTAAVTLRRFGIDEFVFEKVRRCGTIGWRCAGSRRRRRVLVGVGR